MNPTHDTYAAFEEAFDHFNARLFSSRLPSVLITLQVNKKAAGHFWAQRFGHIEDTKVHAHEIAMNASLFKRQTMTEILATFVHEMVHLRQQLEGTPGKARYHNREWAGMMKEVGLQPSTTGQPGGAETGTKLSHYPLAGGPFALACRDLLAGGFKLHWHDRGLGEKKKTKQGKRQKFKCPECGLAAWARFEARLTCTDCGEPLLPID